jgi:cytochrome bd-type quinol oxidase subunit 1
MLLPVQVFLGDSVAAAEFPYQLSKAEAVEGNWTNGNTGWVIFAIPDQQAQRNIAELELRCSVAGAGRRPRQPDREPGSGQRCVLRL